VRVYECVLSMRTLCVFFLCMPVLCVCMCVRDFVCTFLCVCVRLCLCVFVCESGPVYFVVCVFFLGLLFLRVRVCVCVCLRGSVCLRLCV